MNRDNTSKLPDRRMIKDYTLLMAGHVINQGMHQTWDYEAFHRIGEQTIRVSIHVDEVKHQSRVHAWTFSARHSSWSQLSTVYFIESAAVALGGYCNDLQRMQAAAEEDETMLLLKAEMIIFGTPLRGTVD